LEAIMSAGADFVCIDMCNGWLSIDKVADLLAVRSGACSRFVRLAAGASQDIAGQLLDAGADGLVFAHVSTAVAARAWTEACLFPPEGSRGMGSTGRAGEWGLASRNEYLATGSATSPRRPMISVMVEDLQAVAEVDAIAAIPAINQLVVGTADLGLAFGEDNAGVEHALDAVAHACQRHGKSAAIALGSPDRAAEMVQRGYDAIYLSNDLTLLARAAALAFSTARGEVR
jgi:2-keto-3-deoxy-L-rhamnonate aldolase RhmA